jgi:predicted secreted protein
MAKRLALVWAMFLLAALAASAGDVAQFVNLGFSADAKYFLFGQYGIAEKDSVPWADTFIVDIAKNAFVPKGTVSFKGKQAVDPGANGLGALIDAVETGLPQTQKLKIDHLLTGRLLYILVDGADAPDAIEFRDFQSGKSYKLTLTQVATPKDASSSFSIAVTVTDKDGKTSTFTVGDPKFVRAGVKAYHIKQIILGPDGSSLVFVVQREEQDTKGNNIRYMVEVVRPK